MYRNVGSCRVCTPTRRKEWLRTPRLRSASFITSKKSRVIVSISFLKIFALKHSHSTEARGYRPRHPWYWQDAETSQYLKFRRDFQHSGTHCYSPNIFAYGGTWLPYTTHCHAPERLCIYGCFEEIMPRFLCTHTCWSARVHVSSLLDCRSGKYTPKSALGWHLYIVHRKLLTTKQKTSTINMRAHALFFLRLKVECLYKVWKLLTKEQEPFTIHTWAHALSLVRIEVECPNKVLMTLCSPDSPTSMRLHEGIARRVCEHIDLLFMWEVIVTHVFSTFLLESDTGSAIPASFMKLGVWHLFLPDHYGSKSDPRKAWRKEGPHHLQTSTNSSVSKSMDHFCDSADVYGWKGTGKDAYGFCGF